MRQILIGLVLFALSFSPVFAGEQDCLISFDSARLDICSGSLELESQALASLGQVALLDQSPYRIVKFDGPIARQDRQDLSRLGIEILDYVPFHAYLVRMDPSLERQVLALERVVWTGPYLPAFKVGINLARDMDGAGIVDQADINGLSVSLHAGVDAVQGRTVLAAHESLEILFVEDGGVEQRLVVDFDRASLSSVVSNLAMVDEVAAIQLRWNVRTMNSQAGWLHQSGVSPQRPIFDQGIFGCGEVVGVLDSGLHMPHCSFNDPAENPAFDNCGAGTNCSAITPNFDHRKVPAYYKWSGLAGGAGDGDGHGTHVVGSITGNNLSNPVDCSTFSTPGGNSNLDGTAPGAKLIMQEAGASLQYLNSQGGTIRHAAGVAFQNGARVHNNSWGSSCTNQFGQCIAGCTMGYIASTRDADRVVWENPQLALLVAAGNDGTACPAGNNVGAPANAKNVFSIGSNNRGTGGNNMSGFSSRGPTNDRRLKPDMSAQGGGIVSAARNACGTLTLSGTSMASPTAGGLAALVREYLGRGFYPTGLENPSDSISDPSGALVKALMLNGAQEITGTGTGGSAPSVSQGWGRINLDNVLFFFGDQRNLWLLDQTTGLQTGQVDSVELDVAGGQPLVVNLVWHDAPATLNANPAIVNLLRLEVEAPNGQVWTQKLPAGGGLTNPIPFVDTTTSNFDDRNTVHEVRIDNPQAGTWQVRVRGIQVATAQNQPYALVATGSLVAGDVELPVMEVSPGSLVTTLAQGQSSDLTLNISNATGTATLNWMIEQAESVAGLRGSHDPALDEVLNVPNFAATGGGPSAVFDIAAGISSQANVVGITFEGTVSGISGNNSWASDLKLVLTSPGGPQFSAGGFDSPGDATWDFDGGGSSENGTYTSVHFNLFGANGTPDAGDWNLVFSNNWAGGGVTQNWSDVSITLHKQVPPPCSLITDVPWLSATPDNGSLDAGLNTDVTVGINAASLSEGMHTADLCVTGNDPLNPLVVVPVEVTVLSDDIPQIEVDPISVGVSVPVDGMTSAMLDITNIGQGTLTWQIDQTATPDTVLWPGEVTSVVVNDVDLSTRLSAPGQLAGSALLDSGRWRQHEFTRGGGTVLTHSTSLDVVPGTVACSPDGGVSTTANSFLRTFTLGDFGIVGDFEVAEVQFGIENLSAAADISVNLYALDGAFVFANMSLIGTVTENLAAQSLSLVSVPVSGTVPAGGTLVVEIAAPDLDGVAAFFAGSNGLGESAPSYLVAPGCGIAEPATYASINFPNVHLVMTVTGAELSGQSCQLPDWLNAAPMSGSLSAMQGEAVALDFDATGLEEGLFEASLCIVSNDPAAPQVTVPVSMQVTDAGPVTFTVTPSSGGGGSIDPATPQTVNENATVEFTLTPDPGHSIAGVGGTCGGNLVGTTFTTDPVAADCTVEASFVIDSHVVTVTANPPEGGTVDGGGSFDFGTEITVEAVASAGYSFVNWTEDGTEVSTEAAYTFTVESDRTLVANFSLNEHTVAVSAEPAEGGSVSGGGTFDFGAEITVEANANAGYSFVNWTEGGTAVSTDAAYTFTVESDRTLVANFIVIEDELFEDRFESDTQ